MDGVIRYLARDALAESLKQAVAKNEPGLWVRAADFDDRQAQAKQREVALQDRLTAAEQQIDEFPSLHIEGCQFVGYNADGTEPFEFVGKTIKKLKSINMSGWLCEGPLKKEGMFERDLPDVAVPEQQLDERNGTCEWTDEDGVGTWHSSCGVFWSFHEEGPVENGMNFCHSCGKAVAVKADDSNPQAESHE
ncbi:hypothetical protein HUW52_27540 [Pseudomonas sp. 43A]|uniref:hypothetical protein n=1 Tax=unclassified Pseudomonas TaxID=196821 RepID=UPI0015879AC0|nr:MULTISPECIES: hypothetical protein [unclassified Pseudomonas]QKV66510.1 hypothetical protein HUW52_27540 [Pseudomonas sp. 43A]QMW11037.1 hypothetical protein H3303_05165 [Pseudomonas sp. 29A]